jgi:hypothetical protein
MQVNSGPVINVAVWIISLKTAHLSSVFAVIIMVIFKNGADRQVNAM